ncbi:EAL domain-containing protein [Thermomonas sp.]|uniref:sensor domain-containing protein n=1 Tax=Thermomonas sp. TaxID=1971895 RepID=UPI0035AF7930
MHTGDPRQDDFHWMLQCLEHLDEMVVVTDAVLEGDGPHIRYVNAAFERTTGWPRAEILGRAPRFLQGPGTEAATLARIRTALEAGRPVQAELLNYARDGREYRIHTHIQPMRAADGTLEGFIAIQRGLGRDSGDAALTRQLGEWFEGAAASSLSALYILAAERDARGAVVDFRYLYVNRMGGELLQATPEALLGRSLRETLPPSRVEALIARCADAMATATPFIEEFEVAEYDEPMHWLRHQVVPLSDGVAITSDNISERKRAEAALAQREEWFRAAAEGSHNALYINEAVRDAQGEVVDFTFAYVNPRGGELVGMAPEDMVGRSITALFPINREPGFFDHYREVFLSGTPTVREFPIAAPGIHARWLRQREIPWSRGVVLSPEDITARKQAEIELRNREETLEAFLENCPGICWVGDEHGRTLIGNAAYRRMLAALGVDRLPERLEDAFPPELAALYHRNHLRVIESGRAERILEPGLREDGSPGSFEVFKFPLGERNGVRLVGGIALDITEREGERQATERLAAIVRDSGDAILSKDLTGHIVSLNRAGEQLYGYGPGELIGRPLAVLVPPEDLPEVERATDRVRNGEAQVRFESVRLRRDGTRVPVQVTLSPIIDRDGQLIGFSSIATDISERRHREQQARFYAEHDPVTGVLNEHGLLVAADAAFAAAPDEAFALLRLSVDRYAEFRDVFGVSHANALAVQVVQRMAAVLADRAPQVARIGHNQFAALVRCRRDEADCVDRHLGAIVTAMAAPLAVLGIEVSTTIQCGAAVYPLHAEDAEGLMRCADLAFGQAKRNADHQPVVYQPAMGAQVKRQVHLQQELSRALERGQLRVVLQPIWNADAVPRPVGLEALVRWRHPQLGDVTPSEFIPVAEESGLIPAIGAFMLRESCRLHAALAQAGHRGLFLSVNVSRDQFRRGDLAALVADVLAECGLPGAALELEITEGVLMEHSEDSERQLQALSALGVGLAVDDFGTGYSSLAYLQRFPVTKLKIDRSFVSGLPEDRNAAEIVRTILTLARSLGLQTLAEGVETPGQQQTLLALGCEQLQGFLLSRPLETADVTDFLARHPPAPPGRGAR